MLQGLGVTYSHLRALLVARLDPGGEAAVEAMEQAYGFLQELAAPGGLVAAWHQVLGLTGVHIPDLVGLVVGGAMSWLEGRLAVSVTEHLLTLCSGAGSIVAVIQSIYNAVTPSPSSSTIATPSPRWPIGCSGWSRPLRGARPPISPTSAARSRPRWPVRCRC